MSVRYIGRENVRKRLAPLEGTPGRTVYADGAAELESDTEHLAGAPDFRPRARGHLRDASTSRRCSTRSPPTISSRSSWCGSAAMRSASSRASSLVASKVGSRFVKNRHKKGGSSSNRFRRRRDEQAKALVEEAAEVAAAVLTPWRERAEFTALGGDRSAVELALATRADLAWLRERAIPRFLDVPEPRHRTLEALPYDLYAVQFERCQTPGVS